MLPLNVEPSRIAGLLTALFDRWGLTDAQRAALLGEWPPDETGQAYGKRGRELLAVHALLRLLFRRNPECRYSWIATPNGHFDGARPIDVMVDDPQGVPRVKAYLMSQLG